ncbi:hypothetical protein M9978_02440 [Sphingomonas sp. MG17]|uniref:Uncharacterized protein n=1 Tax=Sphingomonas tagetis TaxID=2949092 RepID=A0A9X2HMX9_9SPHN|nr:hypothetical protein [Sphingomonas tagetis]MCP3729275.1 hypothetical protein [Sphingomonas tagetis]
MGLMVNHAALREQIEALPDGSSVALDKTSMLGLVRDLELGAIARSVLAGRVDAHVALKELRT